MTALYSVSLIVALLTGAFALLGGVFALLKSGAHELPAVRLWIRTSIGALALGTLSLVISVLVHLLWGHGPMSVQPLDF